MFRLLWVIFRHKFQDLLYILFYSFYVLQFLSNYCNRDPFLRYKNQNQCLYGVREGCDWYLFWYSLLFVFGGGGFHALVPRFSWQRHGMMVGCQPTQAAFTPKNYSWYSFLLEAESTPGPLCVRKDFMSMKNPLTLAGIEPATYRFVAQHLNHFANAVPLFFCLMGINFFPEALGCYRAMYLFPSKLLERNLHPPKTVRLYF